MATGSGEIYQEQRSKDLGLPLGTGKRYSQEDLETLASEVDKNGYTSLTPGGLRTCLLRPLNAEEKTALNNLRAKLIEKYTPFVGENVNAFNRVISRSKDSDLVKQITVAFDTEEELSSFVKAVRSAGRGIEITVTILPFLNSLLVRRSIVEDLALGHNLRPATAKDLQNTAARMVSPYSFDTANLSNHFAFVEASEKSRDFSY